MDSVSRGPRGASPCGSTNHTRPRSGEGSPRNRAGAVTEAPERIAELEAEAVPKHVALRLPGDMRIGRVVVSTLLVSFTAANRLGPAQAGCAHGTDNRTESGAPHEPRVGRRARFGAKQPRNARCGEIDRTCDRRAWGDSPPSPDSSSSFCRETDHGRSFGLVPGSNRAPSGAVFQRSRHPDQFHSERWTRVDG